MKVVKVTVDVTGLLSYSIQILVYIIRSYKKTFLFSLDRIVDFEIL